MTYESPDAGHPGESEQRGLRAFPGDGSSNSLLAGTTGKARVTRTKRRVPPATERPR